MSLHEHRTRRTKDVTPARAAAEQLFKKTPATPSVPATPAPAPTPPNPFDNKVSLLISAKDTGTVQATFVIGRKMWTDIGRPPRVDIIGLPQEGYQIRAGNKYKAQSGDTSSNNKKAVRVQTTCRMIGLPVQEQERTMLHASIKDGFIQLDAVPPEWMGFDPNTPKPDVPQETGTVLADLQQEPDKLAEEQTNNDIGHVVLRSNSAGMMLAFGVPAHLLVKIGEPKRVVISGTPHQGWMLRESHEGGVGVTVNYKTGPNCYLTRGLSDQKMPDKRGRKKFSIRMTAEGDHIKIAGPNFEWIRGANTWLADPPVAPLATVTNGHMGHQEPNGNGGHSGVSPVAKNGQAMALPQVGDVPSLQADLAQHLANARETKAKLEQITGMKLVFTKDGNVTVSFMVPGAIAPKDQKAAPAIT